MGTKETKPRPWKFDEPRRARFLGLLRKGYSRSGAAAAVGVDRRTIQRAMKVARFARRVEESEGAAVGQIEAVLFRKAKQGHFQSISFLLCNRARERWSHPSKIEVGGSETPMRIEDILREIDQERTAAEARARGNGADGYGPVDLDTSRHAATGRRGQ